MQSSPTLVKMNKTLFFILLFLLGILVKTTSAQEIIDTPIRYILKYHTAEDYKPFPVMGRVIGTNLESIKNGEVINICSGQTTKADDNGIFHFQAGKGDTLAFISSKYSPTIIGVKSPKDKFNIILIKRKTAALPPGHTRSDYEKAKKEDEDLYKILDKDAKEEGKWNY